MILLVIDDFSDTVEVLVGFKLIAAVSLGMGCPNESLLQTILQHSALILELVSSNLKLS